MESISSTRRQVTSPEDKVDISLTMRKRHPAHIKHASNQQFQGAHSLAKGVLWQLWEDILILDEEMTASMSVCAHKDSACASLRPLMKLIELSFHGIIWLAGTVAAFLISHRVQDIEVIVNLLFALLFDLIIVGLTKIIFRRSRPLQNRMDMFATVSVDKFSFPSGHATRAALVAMFFTRNVVSLPYVPFVILFCTCVGVSRILLGRHHIIDVLFGYIIGVLEYVMYSHFWVSGLVLEEWLDDYFGHVHL